MTGDITAAVEAVADAIDSRIMDNTDYWISPDTAEECARDAITALTGLGALMPDDAAQLRAQRDRVLALHRRFRGVISDADSCEECTSLADKYIPHPCPTVRAYGQAGDRS